MSALLEVSDLGVEFRLRRQRVRAVDGLSYSVDVGQTLAVIGESGSGKTVSSRAVIGLLPETASVSGSVRIDGQELIGLREAELQAHRGASIAMVFQDPSRALNPTMRIGSQITEAIEAHLPIKGVAARERAIDLLERVRLPAPSQRFVEYPHQLSGGMRQRVAIAIALASNPRLLIADEATSSLDVTTQAQIMELLTDLQSDLGMGLVMISHDLGLAASFADEVVVMHSGRAVERAPTRKLFAQVQTPYTRALLDAIPRLDSPPHAAPGAAGNGTLLEARDVVQEFDVRAGVVQAVSGVSLEVRAGETLGIVGETGSGKSTLARSLLQAPRPKSGSVVFQGEELVGLRGRKLLGARRSMQMVFQDPFGSLDPKWSVARIVEEPLRAYRVGDRHGRRARVREVLDRVGLDPEVFAGRRPRQLSGGQAQRVAIARALALDPALIICDEAVSSLDVLIQAQVLELFERLRGELGLSYLFIAHDLALVKQVSDRVGVMYLGKLVEIGPAESIYREPLHPYTFALLASIPSPDPEAPKVQAHESIRGEPPSSIDPPSGCRFRTRCPRAQQRCAVEEPKLRPLGESHYAACHFPVPRDERARLG